MSTIRRRAIGAAALTLTPFMASTVARAETAAPPTAYPAEAAGDGATINGYNLSRWAEDWRRYRDPAKRDDPLDRLKFLPLADDGNVYLTLSGELRLRMNLTTNPGLLHSEAQRQDIMRIVGGADLHVGSHFRVYGELATGHLTGRNIGTPAGTMRNDLIVQQLFGEAKDTIGGVDVGVRVGRQEFTDGSNLLTSQRDNNTIRFVLNGVRGWARGKTVRADIFDFAMTRYGTEGIGDDKIDRERRFSGITVGLVVPRTMFGGSKLYFDPYVWRLRHRALGWGTMTAREERYYYGARLWGDVGRVALDWTVNHQGGHHGSRDIDAWQALTAQTLKLGKTATTPRIGFHADYGSGGGSFGSGTLRAATAPFGNNIYYSYGLFLTPTNMATVAPTFAFTPLKGVRLSTEYQWAWRDREGDAVYRANGTPYARTHLVGGKSVAGLARAQLVYSITPRLSFTGRYEHLNAGPVLTKAGYTDSDFMAGWLSFRF